MNTFLRNILTGADDTSFESGRVIWVFGALSFIVSFIVFQGIALWVKGQPFSPVEFGTGFGGGLGAVLAAGGFGIAAKDKATAGGTA